MARKKKTRTKSISTDPVSAYAQSVASGKVIAGPHVRAACKRHLDDLENGHERGLTWHAEEVARVIGFFHDVLTIEKELPDEEGRNTSVVTPFHLEPAEAFIVGSLFGWRNAAGHRRFRRAFVELGKGNGKSPIAAGIGHYMLLATGKLRAEVYAAATDYDQAMIMFRDAIEMYRRSPALFSRLIPSGQNPVWQLTHLPSAGFFKPISSEKKGKSGIRPYCALLDEIHEHSDDSVIEMLRAGTKGNQEALILEITNSGFDKASVCGREHDYAIEVAAGEKHNDAWFSYVAALDEKDDPFEDESCWIKANPLLGVSIHPAFIREQVTEARGMPSKEGLVRRLHFCQWTEGEQGWMTHATWKALETELAIDDYKGRRCYGGLDLSYTRDLSAFALVFPDGNTFDAFTWLWKPKDDLQRAIREDGAPYDTWARDGFLELTEGPVIRLEPIAQTLAECASRYDLRSIAFDRYRHRELADDMADLGIELPMVEHPQGFRRAPHCDLWMPSSVNILENAIAEQRLRVQHNPVLRWNALSAVIRPDPAGTDNRVFDKRRSRTRIDGIVALAMALGVASQRRRGLALPPLNEILSGSAA